MANFEKDTFVPVEVIDSWKENYKSRKHFYVNKT